MSCFSRYKKTSSLRLMLFIGLLLGSVIPVHSWVSAQTGSAPIWVVRSLSMREYGVNDPKGLAFSSEENTFFVLDGSSNVTLVTMDEDPAGMRVIPNVQDEPLNAAFDKKSGSLFVFNRGNSELVKIQANDKGLPDAAAQPRSDVKALNLGNPQGLAFDSASGRLFILDADTSQIISVLPHPTLGFDADEAVRSNKVQHISLKKLGLGSLKGLAYHPGNGHLYVSEPSQKKLYELSQDGDLVSTFDLAALGINDPSAMTFAPSVDNTDDPNIYDLFLLDRGKTEQSAKAGLSAPVQQTTASESQIVELSLVAPAALPAGTTLLPASLVRIIDTSKAAWNPSSPDPAGVDYWPLTNRLLIADSEVDEMSAYWQGKNVFLSTTAGALTGTCTTIGFTGEPTGVAINPNNNHIFFSTDFNDQIFEVSLGGDGQYCTGDDTVTSTSVGSLYGIRDTEDVAYGNNTLFIAGGDAAEVYRIPLGANGVLGGGDDGAMTHFDTAALGFGDMEALGYNANNGTLFIASPKPSDRYLGEVTITGTLLRAYDLALMGTAGNIRSDVTYAPSSHNPGIKSIYIASRGVDNDSSRLENDGKIWEISLGGTPTTPPTPVPSNASTWYIRGIGAYVYGTHGDTPVPADYNGDGKADIAVFQPSSSTWYINGVGSFKFGTKGDISVVADYNGDRKADIAVFQPSSSTWYIYGVGNFVYGSTGDIPVVADYNGDGRADIAVFRPSNSTWYIYGLGSFVYGQSGDIPVIADYNGDRKAEIAVFRP